MPQASLAAGDLDRRIVIQRYTVTRDEYNAEVPAWTDLATRWAKYEPVSDGERLRAGERASEIGARFTIRWSQVLADLNPKDQVIFQGRTYPITRVKEIGRRVGLEITVTGRDDQDG